MDDRSIYGEQYAQKNFVAIGIPTLTPIILAINVKSTEATSKVTNLGVSTLNLYFLIHLPIRYNNIKFNML